MNTFLLVGSLIIVVISLCFIFYRTGIADGDLEAKQYARDSGSFYVQGVSYVVVERDKLIPHKDYIPGKLVWYGNVPESPIPKTTEDVRKG